MSRVLLFLALPNALFSAAMVQHSTSLVVALVYLVCAPLTLLAILRLVAMLVFADKPSLGLACLAGFFVVAAAVFAVVYPIADARKVVGAGTDADDALDLAVGSLLRGEYLYTQRTYLNNPITPLPGWIALAAPFVVLFGRAAYLNVFWLGVWLGVLVVLARSTWVAAVLAVATFAFFPGVSITFLNGSDSFASVVAIGLLVVLLERLPGGAATPRSKDKLASWVVLGMLTGVVLSSRFNVVLLLPVLAAVAVRRAGSRLGLAYGAVAGLVWLGVSFAPWLVDPVDFTPLHTYGMLGRFDSVLPYFGLLVPAATGILALALGWRVAKDAFDPWLAMALVLSVPVACGFLADIAVSRQLDLWPLVYGLMATPLWVGASVPAVASLLTEQRAGDQPPFWRLAARSASASRS